MELLINIYLVVAILTLLISGFGLLLGVEFEVEINNVWDLLVYSIFWFIHPLKSLVKLIVNIL